MKLIAVTMGDATGIGPEIVVKTFADVGFIKSHATFVIGDAGVLRRQTAALGLPLDIVTVSAINQIAPRPGVLEVLNTSDLPRDLPQGKISALAGKAAFDAIRTAIEFAIRKEIAGICTAPIHKEALAAAQVPYPGHTEMLAELSGTRDYAMMLVNPTLRTILVTVHCALSEAIARLSIENELRIIRLAHRTLRDLGIDRPRIAVAGLNPHAGEGGLFGREDIDIIEPAIQAARTEGIDASGPWPGDTVFMNARRGKFDIVVAQYHDQGLIPVKLAGMEDGVNITVGLPFVRTSPDHGTAFDIAGQGIADPSSLKIALETAHRFIRP
ncbi:4-hydroxythreonine-4-phosphate dehydrogenase PdxA [Janthinobacterium agaricidamnosum]|uniref:4-hydroxythreonine-4-phosphate dehydrogenase n=1 Tax=Janthinobacterium agaricidamnosum NBRC 102515 = DSM 9628 TaxID=1349767 RepID=W0V3Q5_9BURK|nr:4-hydroxythreonine-4-phosphate dehydrogenase PdxA [Janthinobacterium agaricidamnosum]CDG82501.1 4-hydroxythreonine-4-phosphate dehydrogenase [Janthinobacterium agaricidamnosum NBRC 102515 = DSM 9628]